MNHPMNTLIDVEVVDTRTIGSGGLAVATSSNAMESNKSSLSSSTSSLVSSNSASTTPVVFAPPPTPLQQSTATSQVALPGPGTFQTISNKSSTINHPHTVPIYQLTNSTNCCLGGIGGGFCEQFAPTNNSSSSFVESLVDTGAMITRLNRFGGLAATADVANSKSFQHNSGSSGSNRRECKSTSDESYTLELEEQSLIASATNKIEKMSAASTRGTTLGSSQLDNGDLLNSTSSLIYPLSAGRFGFNPLASLETTFPSRLRASSRSSRISLSGVGSVRSSYTSGTSIGGGRKTLKRLSGQSKFFIDNLKKANHRDYNCHKKLFYAVSNNDIKTVQELLDSNSYDVNCFDDKQRTCLHVASSRGYVELVRVLLEYGANPNIRDCVNNLPIHLAIISSHVQCVTVLLEAGTDIHSLDLNGKTVLHLAGTRLRWLLNDDNHKASPKLKFEAIMIMNMIKEYLRRKKTTTTSDLDSLVNQLENSFNLDDINSITHQLLDQFETLNINNNNIN